MHSTVENGYEGLVSISEICGDHRNLLDLDRGELVMDQERQGVSAGELEEIVEEHRCEGRFMLTQRSGDDVRALRSVKGSWALQDLDKEFYDEMNIHNSIKTYRLNALKYPLINAFIKAGRVIHAGAVALCDTPNDTDGVEHADMKKCYTQHLACGKYYRKFPGAITHHCRFAEPITDMGFLDTHIGLFQVRVKFVPEGYLQRLGLEIGLIILPSVEIQYLEGCGVVFEIIAGCWARHTFDISYTDAILEKRRYCTWAGKLGQETPIDQYTFEGDKEWASHLAAELGSDKVSWIPFKKMIQISVPSGSVNTAHHVLAFITAYARINILSLMKTVEPVKVVLDGLYYRGTIDAGEIALDYGKTLKTHDGFARGWYCPTEFDTSKFPIYNPSFDPPAGVNHIVLTGAGGTGKSHSVYRNSNLLGALYVVASKALGEDKREEFGCQYATIHRMLGDISGAECESYLDRGWVPSVGMADEITQYDRDWIVRLLKKYPTTFWLLAGDVDCEKWFQCRSGTETREYDLWLPSRTDFIVPYVTDYRSLDEELRVLKVELRDEMNRVFTDGGSADTYRLTRWIIARCKGATMTAAKALKATRRGDIWLAGKHSTNKLLLEEGVVSGQQDKRTRRLFYDVEEGNLNRETRGSFTVHSFQGLTIADKKVFIALDFFEYSMAATAIGRVRNYNQLVFVK